MAPASKAEPVERDYGLTATPTNFLLDSKGKVIYKHAGYKPGDEKTLENRIQKALNP